MNTVLYSIIVAPFRFCYDLQGKISASESLIQVLKIQNAPIIAKHSFEWCNDAFT